MCFPRSTAFQSFVPEANPDSVTIEHHDFCDPGGAPSISEQIRSEKAAHRRDEKMFASLRRVKSPEYTENSYNVTSGRQKPNLK